MTVYLLKSDYWLPRYGQKRDLNCSFHALSVRYKNTDEDDTVYMSSEVVSIYLVHFMDDVTFGFFLESLFLI